MPPLSSRSGSSPVSPIPTGLRPLAQGCSRKQAQRRELPWVPRPHPLQPQRGCRPPLQLLLHLARGSPTTSPIPFSPPHRDDPHRVDVPFRSAHRRRPNRNRPIRQRANRQRERRATIAVPILTLQCAICNMPERTHTPRDSMQVLPNLRARRNPDRSALERRPQLREQLPLQPGRELA